MDCAEAALDGEGVWRERARDCGRYGDVEEFGQTVAIGADVGVFVWRKVLVGWLVVAEAKEVRYF